MTTKNIYNKKILMIIRIISLSILILLSITTPQKFYKTILILKEIECSNLEKIVELSSLLLNCLVIISSAILIKYPHKFFLIGIGALDYSLGMAIWDLEATMSLLMLCVTFCTLLLRNNFTT